MRWLKAIAVGCSMGVGVGVVHAIVGYTFEEVMFRTAEMAFHYSLATLVLTWCLLSESKQTD